MTTAKARQMAHSGELACWCAKCEDDRRKVKLFDRLIQAAESCRTLAITFNCPSTEKAMDELLAECKPEAPHVQ